MNYEKELSFFQKILENYRINSCIMTDGDTSYRMADRGLRDSLGLSEDYDQLFCTRHETLKENTIFLLTDNFSCNYIFILLPESENKKTFIAGPYIDREFTQKMLIDAANQYDIPSSLCNQIEKYYTTVPVYADKDIVSSLFISLGELLWGSMDNFTVKSLSLIAPERNFPEVVERLGNHIDDPLLAMKMLESRYEGERKLMKAVSQGIAHKAEQMISNSTELMLEMRVPDPVRNMKNYVIVANVLLRKAVEQGGVHPFYIDGVSSDFAKKVEKIKSVQEGIDMMHDMIYKYCALVKNHSMKNYSLLVQKVITVIDSDLTADLSLHHQAEMLNVNASYLSTLFKKETGMTLTEYVTRKRIEHAAFLLTSTNLQIQAVAQNCGIYDVNYFTKIFKKQMGKTPREYREKALKF